VYIMGGASSWYSIFAIVGFLTAIWCSGKAAKLVGISSIVFEVTAGLVLGQKVLGLIPTELSGCFHEQTIDCKSREAQETIARKGVEFCDLQAYLDHGKYTPGEHWSTGFWGGGEDPVVTVNGRDYDLSSQSRRLGSSNEGKADYANYIECLEEGCGLDLALKCAATPDIFTLVGHAGVGMMIFESGMHFDFEQARTVGHWACAVAVLGTFLPIIFGTGLTVLFGFEFFPDGVSVGVALSPTSIGIALRLLHEVKALQTYYGQVVMTAAFVDDVLALICFSVLFSLQGEVTALTFLPLICGCIFMVIAIIACVKVWPRLLKWIFSVVKETKPNAKLTRHDEVMWVVMFLTVAVYGQITHLCGTHLWGCFIAGMSFSHDHHAHHVWVRQVKRLTCWFMRLFFACTLAWAIPVGDLFSIEAFWKGTLMGIGPCVLTKVLCGPFMGDARWVIGWAMVGRAEFAYFIGIMAKSLKMMEDKVFAILIWALIYATIFAPLIFRKVLARYIAKLEKNNPKNPETEESADPAQPEGHVLSSRGRCDSFSGHLPDLEEEELEKKHASEVKEREAMVLSLQEKDAEIARLQDALTKIEEAFSGVAAAKTRNSGEGVSGDTPKRDQDIYV